jgi:hypothetical protein
MCVDALAVQGRLHVLPIWSVPTCAASDADNPSRANPTAEFAGFPPASTVSA